MLVHVQVTILCNFCRYNLRVDLRVQNIHHFRERILALNERNRVRCVCRVFCLAGLHVHQEPRRGCLRDGMPLRIENGIILKTNFVLDDVFSPCGNGELFAPDRVVQQANLQSRDDRGVASLHHLPYPKAVLFGIGDGGFFHEQEEI